MCEEKPLEAYSKAIYYCVRRERKNVQSPISIMEFMHLV